MYNRWHYLAVVIWILVYEREQVSVAGDHVTSHHPLRLEVSPWCGTCGHDGGTPPGSPSLHWHDQGCVECWHWGRGSDRWAGEHWNLLLHLSTVMPGRCETYLSVEWYNMYICVYIYTKTHLTHNSHTCIIIYVYLTIWRAHKIWTHEQS